MNIPGLYKMGLTDTFPLRMTQLAIVFFGTLSILAGMGTKCVKQVRDSNGTTKATSDSSLTTRAIIAGSVAMIIAFFINELMAQDDISSDLSKHNINDPNKQLMFRALFVASIGFPVVGYWIVAKNLYPLRNGATEEDTKCTSAGNVFDSAYQALEPLQTYFIGFSIILVVLVFTAVYHKYFLGRSISASISDTPDLRDKELKHLQNSGIDTLNLSDFGD